MANYIEKFLTAIDIITEDAVDKAAYDKTIRAVIKATNEVNPHIYEVEYAGNFTQAKGAKGYQVNDIVYMMRPNNDTNASWQIIGSEWASSLSGEKEDITQISDKWATNGGNMLTSNSSVSCKDGETLVLYKYDQSPQNSIIQLNQDQMKAYIKKSQGILLGADFKTLFPDEFFITDDWELCNYGLIVTLAFKDKTADFSLDINHMTGFPYKYDDWTTQQYYFLIEEDVESFIRVEKITLFLENYPAVNEKYPEADSPKVGIKNFRLFNLQDIEKLDEKGSLEIGFANGDTFSINDNGEGVDTLKIWSVVLTSREFSTIEYEWYIDNPILSGGWKKLETREDELVLSAEECQRAKGKIKCRVIYTYSNEKIILESNELEVKSDASNIININLIQFPQINSDGMVTSITLQPENSNYNYVWTKDSIDIYQTSVKIYNQLENSTINVEYSGVNEDIFIETSESKEMTYNSSLGSRIVINTGLRLDENNTKAPKIDTNASVSTSTLDTIQYYITPPKGEFCYVVIGASASDDQKKGELISVDSLSIDPYTIDKISKITCYAQDKDGYYIGEDTESVLARIKPDDSDKSKRIRVIGAKTYMYNSGGEALEGADNSPLTVVFYDDFGQIIPIYEEDGTLNPLWDKEDVNNYRYSIEWEDLSNKEKSMLRPNKLQETQIDKFYYEIAPYFNYSSINNNIFVTITDLKENISYSNSVDIGFLMNGQPGTNGTDYVCTISDNQEGFYDGDLWTAMKADSSGIFKVILRKISTNEEIIPNYYEWSIFGNPGLENTDLILPSERNKSTVTLTINSELDTEIKSNILQCKVKYDDQIFYGYLPIVVYNSEENDLVENSGAISVLYSSNGMNPQYRKNSPFRLKNKGYGIVYQGPFSTVVNSVGNEIYLKPNASYDGRTVNAGFVLQKDESIIKVPILFSLNRWELAMLNNWDGQSLKMGDDYIVGVSAGFGEKEDDSTFSGIILGAIDRYNDNNSYDRKRGLWGLKKGSQTFYLDSDSGDAYFNGTINANSLFVKDGESKGDIFKVTNDQIVLSVEEGDIKSAITQNVDSISSEVVHKNGESSSQGFGWNLIDDGFSWYKIDNENQIPICTINADGFTLQQGSIAWDNISKPSIDTTEVVGLNYSTEIEKNQIISPSIGGGYLHIENEDKSIGVIIDPNNLTEKNQIFQVYNGENTVIGFDAYGNAKFEGSVITKDGQIAGWGIEKNEIHKTSGTYHVGLASPATDQDIFIYSLNFGNLYVKNNLTEPIDFRGDYFNGDQEPGTVEVEGTLNLSPQNIEKIVLAISDIDVITTSENFIKKQSDDNTSWIVIETNGESGYILIDGQLNQDDMEAIGSSPFYVRADGKAHIEGDIYCNYLEANAGGKLGNWTISNDGLETYYDVDGFRYKTLINSKIHKDIFHTTNFEVQKIELTEEGQENRDNIQYPFFIRPTGSLESNSTYTKLAIDSGEIRIRLSEQENFGTTFSMGGMYFYTGNTEATASITGDGGGYGLFQGEWRIPVDANLQIYSSYQKPDYLSFYYGGITSNQQMCRFMYIPATSDHNSAFTIYSETTDLSLSVGGEYKGRFYGTWLNADGAPVITSDEKRKNSIEILDDRYLLLFDNLAPRRFKYNSGTSDRYHVGFITQEVQEALREAKISEKEFAGVVTFNQGTEQEESGLRYSEFIALNTDQIQKLKARVAELETKCIDYEARIQKLENLLLTTEGGI